MKRADLGLLAGAALLVGGPFLVVSALTGQPAKAPEKAPEQVEKTYHVAVVGDSTTGGTKDGGKGDTGWPRIAWQTLANKGVKVDAAVEAQGGAGYGHRGDQGADFETLAAKAVTDDDNLVVFVGSTNDQGIDPKSFPGYVSRTFDQAHVFAPSAKLLVIGPAWATADPPEELLSVRDGLRDQAGKSGATFVDPIAERWFVDLPGLIAPDGLHPTDAGHAYMAEKIAPLIAKELGGTS